MHSELQKFINVIYLCPDTIDYKFLDTEMKSTKLTFIQEFLSIVQNYK